MRGINKAILIGNLGADPTLRFTQAGMACSNFSIATDYQWKDKETGKTKKVTDWHKIVAFGPLAERCAEYLSKGSLVYVEGRLQTRKWTGHDGHTNYTTEIVIHQMRMLDKRKDYNAYSDEEIETMAAENGTTNEKEENLPVVEEGSPEDDIPF